MCVVIAYFVAVPVGFDEVGERHFPFLLQGGAVFERWSFVCDVTNSCGGPIEEAVPCRQSLRDIGI